MAHGRFSVMMFEMQMRKGRGEIGNGREKMKWQRKEDDKLSKPHSACTAA